MIYPFVAFDTEISTSPSLEISEEIEFRFMELGEIFDLIRSGEFIQSIHIASLMLALEQAGYVHA